MSFYNLNINEQISLELINNGIIVPTEVQRKAIPVALSKKDIIVQSQTGTGKTLAFLLPILKNIKPQKSEIQAVIMTPTRELAMQISSEASKYGKLVDATVLPVYGGQDVDSQVRKLKNGVNMIVGTPGRILDHIRRGNLDITNIKHLVLDEADQMLAMGFMEEIETILDNANKGYQTMLFSATIPKGVKMLARRYAKNPEFIKIESKSLTVEKAELTAIDVKGSEKNELLFKLINEYNPYLGIVFCNTKKRADYLHGVLRENGFDAALITGDLSQAKRKTIMKQFRQAKFQILVATDIVARGIDVDGITHIFNYDLPDSLEYFVHRVGRTARAGEEGLAVTFISQRDRNNLMMIENGISKKLERYAYKEGQVVKLQKKKPKAKPNNDKKQFKRR